MKTRKILYVAAIVFADIVGDFSNHPGVRYIKRNLVNNTFNFHSVTGCDIYKILKSMKAYKATCCDNIPSKLHVLNVAAQCYVNQSDTWLIFQYIHRYFRTCQMVT